MSVQQKPGKPRDSQPDKWEKDLNPNPEAGQNRGPGSEKPGRFDLTAYDIKELHDCLQDYTDDELKQIPVLKEGTRLQQGATYINLNDPARKEFTATGDMSVSNDNLFVPKSEVPYLLWNRLIGVENPDRLPE